MNTLKLGSLFTGYGGLDMATVAAFGAETAWVSDFDTGPNKILAHRYPHVPNLGDITAIDWAAVEPVDIIAGGFPCQDVSLAGRRAGMTEGTRSNLWGAMRTAIETIRPRYVVAENVRGLLSATANSDSDVEPGGGPLGDSGAGHLRALGRVLGDLADIGYDAAWCGLRAADMGAPHGRFRVFIVAEDAMRGGSGGRPARPESPRSDYATLGPSAGGDRGREHPAVNLLPTPDAYAGDRGGSQHPEKRREGGHSITLQDVTEHALLPTPKAGDADMGFPRTSGRPPEMSTHLATRLHYTDFGTYQPAIARWEQYLGRPAPAPTEPNGKNRPRLSARFVEFLMGLPEGWVTDVPGITRNEALKALGNGVVPQQGYAALTHLLPLLERTTR